MKLLTLSIIELAITSHFIPLFNVNTKNPEWTYLTSNTLTEYYDVLTDHLEKKSSNVFILPFVSEEESRKVLNVLFIKNIKHDPIKDPISEKYYFGNFWRHICENDQVLSSKNGELRYKIHKYDLKSLELLNGESLRYQKVPLKIRFAVVPRSYDYWYIKYTIFDWNENFKLNFFMSYESSMREMKKFWKGSLSTLNKCQFIKTENYLTSYITSDAIIESSMPQKIKEGNMKNTIESVDNWFRKNEIKDPVKIYFKPFSNESRFYGFSDNSTMNENDDNNYVIRGSSVPENIKYKDGDSDKLRKINSDGSFAQTDDSGAYKTEYMYFSAILSEIKKNLKISKELEDSGYKQYFPKSISNLLHLMILPYSNNRSQTKKEKICMDASGDGRYVKKLSDEYLGETNEITEDHINFNPFIGKYEYERNKGKLNTQKKLISSENKKFIVDNENPEKINNQTRKPSRKDKFFKGSKNNNSNIEIKKVADKKNKENSENRGWLSKIKRFISGR